MEKLELIVSQEGEEFTVKSPGVGYVENLPVSGQWLHHSSPVGLFKVLGKYFTLKLPSNIQGEVWGETSAGKKVRPVEYEEELFRLRVLQGGDVQLGQEGSEVQELSGQTKVVAPTDGVFYRRPSPDAPLYVEAEEVIESGKTLGLVEVMKCFNPIVYDGPKGKVTEIFVKDAEEVASGQVLFAIEVLNS